MTTLHQLTDNCLAVAGLPSDAYEIRYVKTRAGKLDQLHYRIVPKELMYVTDQRAELIPEGNWRILGKANELTEEQWKEVLSDHRIGSGIYFLGYDNFQDIVYTDTATESGASLLKLHQLENPLILIKE